MPRTHECELFVKQLHTDTVSPAARVLNEPAATAVSTMSFEAAFGSPAATGETTAKIPKRMEVSIDFMMFCFVCFVLLCCEVARLGTHHSLR